MFKSYTGLAEFQSSVSSSWHAPENCDPSHFLAPFYVKADIHIGFLSFNVVVFAHAHSGGYLQWLYIYIHLVLASTGHSELRWWTVLCTLGSVSCVGRLWSWAAVMNLSVSSFNAEFLNH